VRFLLNWRGGNFRGRTARIALNFREHQNSLRFQLQQKGAASTFGNSKRDGDDGNSCGDLIPRNIGIDLTERMEHSNPSKRSEPRENSVLRGCRVDDRRCFFVKLLGVLVQNLLIVLHGAALYTAVGEVSTP